MLEQAGIEFLNPDKVARQFKSTYQGISQEDANSVAWQQGRRLLERAIDERKDFAFETTLGGNTIPALLKKAASSGIEVRIWYVGLESAELHIARVRSRVAMGGHDIPESKIRERYTQSRMRLIELMPALTELKVFDNSRDGDPQKGQAPSPKLLLHMKRGKIVEAYDLRQIPQWAKASSSNRIVNENVARRSAEELNRVDFSSAHSCPDCSALRITCELVK